jgi:hypothetical protein
MVREMLICSKIIGGIYDISSLYIEMYGLFFFNSKNYDGENIWI